jgi:hypothetical protein
LKKNFFTTLRAPFISRFIHSLLFTFNYFPMKTTFYFVRSKPSFCLLLSLMGLLTSFSPVLSQNYNAGTGSGTGGTGTYNVFVGAYAGPKNTIGSANSFLGFKAGNSNTTGSGNSFLGTQAGWYNTTAHNNSFVGSYAGYSNTKGSNNSFVGSGAGYSNTTGDYNSFVGSGAGFWTTTGAVNSFLGYQAGYSNTTGSYNSFLGTEAGYLNTTGTQNSFVGNYAGGANITGSRNVFLGYSADASTGALSNAGAIGSHALVSASNSLVLGAIKGVNDAAASTNVGIGTSAPAYLLHVNGDAAKPGGGSWKVASDGRLKKNVSTFTQGLEVLTQVKPVWFQYNGEAAMPTNKTYVGVIAQEMQKIAPYMVGTFTYQDTTGKKAEYLDYDANALTYILVNAVQQLKKEKDAQIESLQARITRLEQLLSSPLRVSSELAAPSAESDAAARLWQNEPNPTEGTTLIRYRIPRQASQAQIKLYSLKGEELKSFPISQRGEGQLSLDTTRLPEGIYLYRLLIDGQPIDAKKLLLNR